jgi:hypothetical protein
MNPGRHPPISGSVSGSRMVLNGSCVFWLRVFRIAGNATARQALITRNEQVSGSSPLVASPFYLQFAGILLSTSNVCQKYSRFVAAIEVVNRTEGCSLNAKLWVGYNDGNPEVPFVDTRRRGITATTALPNSSAPSLCDRSAAIGPKFACCRHDLLP